MAPTDGSSSRSPSSPPLCGVLLALGVVCCGPTQPAVDPHAEPEAENETEQPPAPRRLHAETLPPLPRDEVPAVLGTPASSLAARPLWAVGYAPQIPSFMNPPDALAAEVKKLPNACALFQGASSEATTGGALRGEMLACRVSSNRTEAKASFPAVTAVTRADLHVIVGFSPKKDQLEVDPRRINVDGPDDTGMACLTLPIMHLALGESLFLSATDTGVFSDDADLGILRLTLQGHLPLETGTPKLQATCRHVPRMLVESHVAKALQLLDQVTHLLDRELMVELDMQSLEAPVFFGRLSLVTAKDFVKYVAAWVGWDDPRVVRRIERLVALEQRFDAELGAALQTLAAKLPPPSAWVTLQRERLSFRVNAIACDDPQRSARYRQALKDKDSWPDHLPVTSSLDCVVHLVIRNDGPAQVRAWASSETVAGVDLRLYDRHGFDWSLEFVGTIEGGQMVLPRKEPIRLAPGAESERLYALRTTRNVWTQFAPDPGALLPNPGRLAPLFVTLYSRQQHFSDPPPETRWLVVPLGRGTASP